MSSTRPAPSAERADGRRNKQSILAAAATALAENPQVSVAEIAERAGLTRATVYRHYPDRDDLVSAVAAEASAAMIPALLEQISRLDWPRALDFLAEQAIALGAEHRELVLLMAPRLEESARRLVAGEPIQAEITARRERGEITIDVTDAWLAVCIRTVCLTAIGQLADPDVDLQTVQHQLALTLRALCGVAPS